MAEKRAGDRDIKPRAPVSQQRRDDSEHDDSLWLKTYLPRVFYNPFTKNQQATIEAAGQCLTYGISKCKCDPRGDGKSTILKYLSLKKALYRRIRFVLLICATGPKSDDSLKSIKAQLRQPSGPLYDDFPFECDVARYVGPAPARANNATYGGRDIRVEWASNRIILPSFVEDPLGSIVMSLGYESDQLQGCNVFDIRPDFVLMDDLDSRESLAAVDGVIAGKIETIIEQTVGGLGGPGRGLGQFYLGTVTSRSSAAYKFSDPQLKPAWSGERTPRIIAWPKHREMWESKYITLRQDGQRAKGDKYDPYGRVAHRYLEANFELMHEGSVISNPFDFDQDMLPDGTRKHLSALQKCYDYIADKGMESFLTEHQNDPPERDSGEESTITSAIVASRISGLEHRQLPISFGNLVSFIDLGHAWCYWVDCAWSNQCVGRIPDYGVFDVQGVTKDSDQKTLERVLIKVLHDWRNSLLGKYRNHEGQTVNPDLALIDSGSGLHTKAVYQFCREVGPPFFPSKGFDSRWRAPKHSVAVGDRWALVPQKEHGNIRLYEFDADHYKQFTHQRFITPTLDDNNLPRPGSLSLFVCPELEQFRKERREYSHQIVGELWGAKKLGAKPGWIQKGKNHYLDGTAGCCMAGNAKGVLLIGEVRAPARKPAVITGGSSRPDGRSWI